MKFPSPDLNKFEEKLKREKNGEEGNKSDEDKVEQMEEVEEEV